MSSSYWAWKTSCTFPKTGASLAINPSFCTCVKILQSCVLHGEASGFPFQSGSPIHSLSAQAAIALIQVTGSINDGLMYCIGWIQRDSALLVAERYQSSCGSCARFKLRRLFGRLDTPAFEPNHSIAHIIGIVESENTIPQCQSPLLFVRARHEGK